MKPFKETLKRFGLLTIAGTTIKLLGEAFDNNKFSLLCYGIPPRLWYLEDLRS